MIDYEDDSVFPAPLDSVRKLLDAHSDDQLITRIHPLLKTQKTVSRAGTETIVDRWTDVRGKLLRSRWRISSVRPDSYRWEVVEGEGPWAPASYVESSYLAVPEGTRITTRGSLKISVLPFFLPQRSTIRKVLDQINEEDLAYLRRP